MGVFALLSILSFPAVVVEAQDPPPKLSSFTGGEYIKPCTPGNGNRFLVNVEGTNINAADEESKCPYSYNNNDQSKSDWEAINGKQFENLETNRFLFDDPVNTQTPTRIRVVDTAPGGAIQFNCGRALWQDKYQDFKFGVTPSSGITSVPSNFPWWPANNKDPVQMTIVPFLGTPDPTSFNCSPINESSFSTEESIAVWLSTDPGVVAAPASSTKYCNVANSAEIDNCLNLPYWIVDTPPAGGISTIKLVGSLYDTLTDVDSKDVSIYVPKKTDMDLPINNMELVYNIVPGVGVTNVEDCKKWAAQENKYLTTPNNYKCLVNGYKKDMTPTTRKVTVSGTGRINGGKVYTKFSFQDVIEAKQRDHGGLPAATTTVSYDLNGVISFKGKSAKRGEIADFLVFANLLAVSSARTTAARGTQLCSATTAAIHVQGVEVASGSRCVYKCIYVYMYIYTRSCYWRYVCLLFAINIHTH